MPRVRDIKKEIEWRTGYQWNYAGDKRQRVILREIKDLLKKHPGSIRTGASRVVVVPDDGDFVYKIAYSPRGEKSSYREANWDGSEPIAKAEIVKSILVGDEEDESREPVQVLRMEKVEPLPNQWGNYDANRPDWLNKYDGDGFQAGTTKDGTVVLFDP